MQHLRGVAGIYVVELLNEEPMPSDTDPRRIQNVFKANRENRKVGRAACLYRRSRDDARVFGDHARFIPVATTEQPKAAEKAIRPLIDSYRVKGRGGPRPEWLYGISTEALRRLALGAFKDAGIGFEAQAFEDLRRPGAEPREQMGRLFYTQNSPYCRISRVAALVLEARVEFVEVAVRESAEELSKYNPAARVRSLELEDGVVLSETRLICEHFEHCGTGTILAQVGDHEGRRWEGLAAGFLDGIAVCVREARRASNEQSPSTIAVEKIRCMRCLNHFEAVWEYGLDMLYAPITLACAIDLMDKRLPLEWRLQHPRLSAWFDTFGTRDELRQTAL